MLHTYIHIIFITIKYMYIRKYEIFGSDWDKQWAKCDNGMLQVSVNVIFPKSMRQMKIYGTHIVKKQVRI